MLEVPSRLEVLVSGQWSVISHIPPLVDTDTASLTLASAKARQRMAITGNGCTCLFPGLIWKYGCVDIPPPSGPHGLINRSIHFLCVRVRELWFEVLFLLYKILSVHLGEWHTGVSFCLFHSWCVAKLHRIYPAWEQAYMRSRTFPNSNKLWSQPKSLWPNRSIVYSSSTLSLKIAPFPYRYPFNVWCWSLCT